MIEDRRLLRRLKRGNRGALRLIYKKYEGDLVTLAASLLHDPGAAEDVVQDVSVKTVLSRYRYGLDKLHSMLNGEVSK